MEYEQKQRFGIERKGGEENQNDENGGVETFWTACPYCWYVYEYEKVYEDYCLRCQNCRNAFHGVSIGGSVPDSALVEGKDQYYCVGHHHTYFDQAGGKANDKENPVGFSSSEQQNAEELRENTATGNQRGLRADQEEEKFSEDSGLEFYLGDDDIYISLSDIFNEEGGKN